MSTFGTLFRVTTYGESHCRAVGCTIDGCPPRLPLEEGDIQVQLTRRRPGQSSLTTPRDEKDRVTILSGTEFGLTLGTPIALTVPNEDQRPHDYSEMDAYPRPSHADWTYLQKYGVKSSSGGGRSSARETIGRVAAGAVAEKYLKLACGVEIVAFVSSVGEIAVPFAWGGEDANGVPGSFLEMLSKLTRADVDADETRCPHKETADRMRQRILTARDAADSIGGTVTCVIRNVPVGLGEPCFDKMQATLAHAMMSIPATKGFEIGSGFGGTKVPGHLHNDMWVSKANAMGTAVLGTSTNNSGGVQGGITNGENVYFRVAFKPPATIGREQRTATYDGVGGVLAAKGRHDPCVVPRAVPIVEAMAALVIMDSFLIQQARISASSLLPPAQIHQVMTGRRPQ